MEVTSPRRTSYSRQFLAVLKVPPRTHPLESLDWSAVCKKCLQNIERQGFRGHSIHNKGLTESTTLRPLLLSGALFSAFRLREARLDVTGFGCGFPFLGWEICLLTWNSRP